LSFYYGRDNRSIIVRQKSLGSRWQTAIIASVSKR